MGLVLLKLLFLRVSSWRTELCLRLFTQMVVHYPFYFCMPTCWRAHVLHKFHQFARVSTSALVCNMQVHFDTMQYLNPACTAEGKLASSAFARTYKIGRIGVPCNGW